jgi:hypothetical protein
MIDLGTDLGIIVCVIAIFSLAFAVFAHWRNWPKAIFTFIYALAIIGLLCVGLMFAIVYSALP